VTASESKDIIAKNIVTLEHGRAARNV